MLLGFLIIMDYLDFLFLHKVAKTLSKYGILLTIISILLIRLNHKCVQTAIKYRFRVGTDYNLSQQTIVINQFTTAAFYPAMNYRAITEKSFQDSISHSRISMIKHNFFLCHFASLSLTHFLSYSLSLTILSLKNMQDVKQPVVNRIDKMLKTLPKRK